MASSSSKRKVDDRSDDDGDDEVDNVEDKKVQKVKMGIFEDELKQAICLHLASFKTYDDLTDFLDHLESKQHDLSHFIPVDKDGLGDIKKQVLRREIETEDKEKKKAAEVATPFKKARKQV